MTHQAPEIVKLAERVLVDIEIAVRGFPRYHKYASGAALREQATKVAILANRAWRDIPKRGEWIGKLVFAIDDLKMHVQVSKQVAAFKSFAQFEALIRLVSDLGRQCGGWHKQHHSKGQNDQSTIGRRAQILSACDTSREVSV